MKTMTTAMMINSVEAQASTLECFTAGVAPLTASVFTAFKRHKNKHTGGRQHERSLPKVGGRQVVPLLHRPADLEPQIHGTERGGRGGLSVCIFSLVSTFGLHSVAGLDEHRIVISIVLSYLLYFSSWSFSSE